MSNLETLPKLLRAIARGTQSIENKHDIIFNSAADKIEELSECVSFFASVIKSGESWTETCDEMYKKVMK